MKRIALLCCALLLGACFAQPASAPTPTAVAPFVIKQEDNPYALQVADAGKRQDKVMITSSDLSERSDLTPVQIDLHILGSMPTTCSQLRIKVNPPNDSGSTLY